MVRHIVMWNFKEEFSEEQNLQNAQNIKRELEELASSIPGVISIKVSYNPLEGSNRDIVLDSLFESKEALEHYQTHPEHVRAGKIVRAAVTDRCCIDYFE